MLDGAPVKFGDSDGELRVVHDEVVGFERPDGRVDWFDPNTLTREIVARYKPWRRARVICRENHAAIIKQYLRELGAIIDDGERFEVETGQIDVESEWSVGDDEMRVAGKIGFNYAAHVLGPQILLTSDFDRARRWIRFGDNPNRNVVQQQKPPMLLGERGPWTDTTGHLLALSWSDSHSLVAFVSLFNSVGFAIELCTRYSGVWFPVDSGHFFDLKNRVVAKLRRRISLL